MEKENKDIVPEVMVDDYIDLNKAPHTLTELSREVFGMIPEKTEKEIYETKGEGSTSSSSSEDSCLNSWFGCVNRAYYDEPNETLYLSSYNDSELDKEYILPNQLYLSYKNMFEVDGTVTKMVFRPVGFLEVPEGEEIIDIGEGTHIFVHPSYG